jgi:L-amino acid N-acyltransferase YncA
MPVEIRLAAAGDARAIAEVHVASWRWAYRGIVADAALERLSVDAREEMWRSWFDSNEARALLFVAVDRGTVVGFAGGGEARDEDATRETAEVRTIYLLEAAAGNGIGRALLSALTDGLRAHGYERATLWVLEGNERTLRFYKAAGWRPDGGREGYEIGGTSYPVVRYTTEL